MSSREKRLTRRFDMHLPVSVSGSETETKEALTRDISHRGLCFVMQESPQLGSELELTITLPAKVTLMEPVRVRCVARVVRVETDPGGMEIAVAASIEDYEFLSPAAEQQVECSTAK